VIPQYPKIRPLEIEDCVKISHYLKDYSPTICELNLANLIIWKKFDNYQITLINDNLCIKADSILGESYFFEPVGKHKIEETVQTCLKNDGEISRASEKLTSQLSHEKYTIKELRDQEDYIYLTTKLAELKGKGFDGKRNHIKKFKKICPDCKFIPLTNKHEKEALNLFEKWSSNKDSGPLPYDAQRKAIENAFKYYDQLGLLGGAFIIKGDFAGFILGSHLNHETATLHFSYGDKQYYGISQALLNSACETIFHNYKYVDLEQDLGIPGLRKSKLSYHPFKMEKKYEVKLKA